MTIIFWIAVAASGWIIFSHVAEEDGKQKQREIDLVDSKYYLD
jgi:hypothetical protein